MAYNACYLHRNVLFRPIAVTTRCYGIGSGLRLPDSTKDKLRRVHKCTYAVERRLILQIVGAGTRIELACLGGWLPTAGI